MFYQIVIAVCNNVRLDYACNMFLYIQLLEHSIGNDTIFSNQKCKIRVRNFKKHTCNCRLEDFSTKSKFWGCVCTFQEDVQEAS